MRSIVLMVPALEAKGKEWPTLGPQVCDWIEENLVYGPGDLRGQPVRLDEEKKALICRMYEVYPHGHALAGRRRFNRVGLSVRKGWAKTELAAMIACAEVSASAPVRTKSWEKVGRVWVPIGGSVTDPFVALVAYTEEQSDELAYSAAKVILEHSAIAHEFDIGEERIMRVGGDGKIVSLAGSPSGTDGARTTFQIFDETHRFTTPKLRKAHTTMLANIPKRREADAWSLETTTSYAPGENSVAEDTMKYAREVQAGKIKDSRLFFFHRQAREDIELFDSDGKIIPENLQIAIEEAAGPIVSAWSNNDSIIGQFQSPTADINYLRRVWLNQATMGSDRAFDADLFASLADPKATIPPGEPVVLSFDGSRNRDSTGLMVTSIPTGLQILIGEWEKPEQKPKSPSDKAEGEWEVPVDEVNSAVALAFETWEVWRLYADPPYWETTVAEWALKYGEKKVVKWYTNNWSKMAHACRAFWNAIKNRQLSHDGNKAYIRHVGNAYKMPVTVLDDKKERMWVITKADKNSPLKIDFAVCGVMGNHARNDAMSEGIGAKKTSVYEERGALWA